MINALLGWIGKILAGPLVDIAGDFFKSQTDREKIRGDVEINRAIVRGSVEVTGLETSANESITSIQAATDQMQKRPFVTVIAQAVLFAIALFYLAALVIASVWPASGLVVQALPGLWELLILAVLAGLAGPYVLNLLKDRFIR